MSVSPTMEAVSRTVPTLRAVSTVCVTLDTSWAAIDLTVAVSST